MSSEITFRIAVDTLLDKRKMYGQPIQPDFDPGPRMMELALNDRIAWVTGAGGALGAAIAETLAAEGAVVYLSGRKAQTLEQARERIASAGRGAAHVLPMDISKRDDVDGAAAAILAASGRIDILVNCTALPIFGSFLELQDSDWEEVLQAKYLGYVRTLRAAIPAMIAQNFGRIVNVSGRGGRQPSPAHLPGSSVNAAVNLLTKGLADLYGKHNIRINVVAPGPIDSPRFSAIASTTDALAQKGETMARNLSATPVPRLGSPQDIADAVAFLVSERAGYTTGCVFPVDGGGIATV